MEEIGGGKLGVYILQVQHLCMKFSKTKKNQFMCKPFISLIKNNGWKLDIFLIYKIDSIQTL